ncbi:MAG: hypothetical protein ACK5MD_01755 [Flavobacteriales bacterium]
MKYLKLLSLSVLLSFGGLTFAQETVVTAQPVVNSENKVVDATTSHLEQMSANELANLDVKSILNLSQEQKQQFAEAEKQYVALRSQLASKGEERAKVEAKIEKLEKRQMSNILDDQQLETFNKTWDLKKKAQQEITGKPQAKKQNIRPVEQSQTEKVKELQIEQVESIEVEPAIKDTYLD